MKISEVRKRFKNRWVLAEVIKQNKLNQLIDIKPILASKDRNQLYEKMATLPRGKKVATLYTGDIKWYQQ